MLEGQEMNEKESRQTRLARLAEKRHALRRSRRMYAFLSRWARRRWVRVTVVPRNS
jgi:hypothetical protein